MQHRKPVASLLAAVTAKQEQQPKKVLSSKSDGATSAKHLAKGGDFYSYNAFVGRKGSRPSSAKRWAMAPSVPRTFDEWAQKDDPDRLNIKWGPKESEFRKKGVQCLEQATERVLQEVNSYHDGKNRRALAEEECRRQRHVASGEPWRSARYGAKRTRFGHLPGSRFHGGPASLCAKGSGLFSEVPLLEALESELRRKLAGLGEDGPSRLSKRPASAPAGRRS